MTRKRICDSLCDNWKLCFDCPFEDCVCDVVTDFEIQQAQAFDILSAKMTGYRTQEQILLSKRYQDKKEQRRRYYQEHKAERLEYYRKNRERLKAQALKRYYEKVKKYE